MRNTQRKLYKAEVLDYVYRWLDDVFTNECSAEAIKACRDDYNEACQESKDGKLYINLEDDYRVASYNRMLVKSETIHELMDMIDKIS